jgi:acyl carrier protein
MGLDDNKLKDIFISALGINAKDFSHQLKLGDTPKWDSLSHFDLVCAIESEFQIRFSTKEIQEILSVDAIREAIEERK